MLELQTDGRRHYYALLRNPVSRVMKFEKFYNYFCQLDSGGTVLDYGAGDRPMEGMLLAKFDNYIAADYPPANEAHAKRPDVEIVDGCLPLSDSSVRCVVLTEVMEHLYEPRKALREIHRVLEPGGSLIGTVPFAMNEHEQPYDFFRYTSFCLRAMFDEARFNIKRLEYVGDNVGVALVCATRVAGIVPKVLNHARLGLLADLSFRVIRLPEMLYYYGVKLGLDPGRIEHFRSYPFGFAFHVTKSDVSADGVHDRPLV